MLYLYIIIYLAIAYTLFGICTILHEKKLIKVESFTLCFLYTSIWPISLPISIIIYIINILYYLLYKLWRKIK